MATLVSHGNHPGVAAGTKGRKSICRGQCPARQKSDRSITTALVGRCNYPGRPTAAGETVRFLPGSPPGPPACRAPGTMDFLDHQFGKRRDLLQLRFAAALRVGTLASGLFIQMETHHVRHIGVNGFVVPHAGAHGIGQHHIPFTIDRQWPGHPSMGPHEKPVDPETHHQYAGKSHPPAVARRWCAYTHNRPSQTGRPLPPTHPHLLGQKGMLK